MCGALTCGSVLSAGDIEPPHGHRIAQHDEKVRLSVVFLVELVLRCARHVQIGGCVRLVPLDDYREG